MVLEPVLDATVVEVVLEVARQRHHLLLCRELAQANAAFILVGEIFLVPANLKELSEHLSRLFQLPAFTLRPLIPVIEEVGNKAGEHDSPQNENYCRERSDYQGDMVCQLQHVDHFFAACRWGLDDSHEVLERPVAKCTVVVHTQSKCEAEELLIVPWTAINAVND